MLMKSKKEPNKQVNPPASPPPDSEFPSAPIEVVKESELQRIETVEIDRQIATAKKFPRSIELFHKSAMTLATQDEEIAESCVYTRPVGTKIINGRKVTEFASGMSVRLAEIAAACYGNIRVYAMLIEATPRFVRCRGMAFDVEGNFASSSEAIESTVTRTGQPYSERMRAVVAKACLAKARRDAIFQVIPRGLLKPIENRVREVLLGDSKTIAKRRKLALTWADEMQIDRARVFASLGIAGEADLGVKQLETLTGVRTAIRDGDTTVDEAFPLLPGADVKKEGGSVGRPLFDDKAGKGQAPAGPPVGGSKRSQSGTASVSEGAGRVYWPAEREAIITDVKNKLLDLNVPESKAFDYLKGLNLVPQGVDELFACPTIVLDLLRPNLPKLALPRSS
jgi:hypothetical protein